MKALWHIDKDSSELRMVKVPQSDKGLKLRSLYSMISTGTEKLVATGGVPSSMHEQMKVPYMDGSFGLPVKYGYSLVGAAEDGSHYHVMHPHQSYVSVDPKVAFRLPEGLPPRRAVLISNMETVINAIWDSHPSTKEKIAIVGFGNVGSLLAITLSEHYGIKPIIVEKDEWRREKASELGFEPSEQTDYDIVYHTTATESGLQYCLDNLKMEGRVIELSWYGDRKAQLTLGDRFHYRRLQIISSQVSVIPKSMLSEYSYKSRKELAAKYLRSDRYDRLINDTTSFTEAVSFFDSLRQGTSDNGLIYLISYL